MARILVIDDNAVNREFAIRILKGMGQIADYAPDGPTAVEIIKSTKYDLILMDICMPGMDGYQAAKYIRAVENPQLRTPIIAVTAYGGVDNHENCRLAGINGFIAKPLTVVKIQAIFDRWVSSRARKIQKLILKKKKFKFGLRVDPL